MESKEWITTQEAENRLGVITACIRQLVAENGWKVSMAMADKIQ